MRFALLVAAAIVAASSAPAGDVSECAPPAPPPIDGCAREWAAARTDGPRIVVAFMFRDLAARRVVEFLEYYLAAGATDFVAFDNSCPGAPRHALDPYVAAGIVAYDARLVCANVSDLALKLSNREKGARARVF